MNGIETKISQNADDTLIILDGKKDSLLNVMDQLNKQVQTIHGLCINQDKSEIIQIGNIRSEEDIYDIPYDLKWNVNSFKSVGIVFSLRVEKMVTINYEEKLKQIQQCLKV